MNDTLVFTKCNSPNPNCHIRVDKELYKDLLKSNQPAPQPTTPAVADSNTNVQYVININGQRVL